MEVIDVKDKLPKKNKSKRKKRNKSRWQFFFFRSGREGALPKTCENVRKHVNLILPRSKTSERLHFGTVW